MKLLMEGAHLVLESTEDYFLYAAFAPPILKVDEGMKS